MHDYCDSHLEDHNNQEIRNQASMFLILSMRLMALGESLVLACAGSTLCSPIPTTNVSITVAPWKKSHFSEANIYVYR